MLNENFGFFFTATHSTQKGYTEEKIQQNQNETVKGSIFVKKKKKQKLYRRTKNPFIHIWRRFLFIPRSGCLIVCMFYIFSLLLLFLCTVDVLSIQFYHRSSSHWVMRWLPAMGKKVHGAFADEKKFFKTMKIWMDRSRVGYSWIETFDCCQQQDETKTTTTKNTHSRAIQGRNCLPKHIPKGFAAFRLEDESRMEEN